MVLNIALDEMSRQKLTLFLCFFGSNAGRGLPMWLSGKESICQCTGLRFDPWVGKIPWRRKWQHITLFLPGEFHGQKSLAGYSPWGHTESDTTEHAHNEGRMDQVWILGSTETEGGGVFQCWGGLSTICVA